jgi:RimJ/RimL family protein N-acetyltransferase
VARGALTAEPTQLQTSTSLVLHWAGSITTALSKFRPRARFALRWARHRRLDDAEAYIELRRKALLDAPLAFSASPADDVASSLEAVREQLRGAPQAVILGAFEDGLVGTVGLFRDRHLKAAHKAHIWGMYVEPAHRRRGLATELLQTAVRHARAMGGVSWVHLSVSFAAPQAQRLYERAGFQIWGTEPDALRHDGRSVAEHHMILHLD